MSRTMTSLYTAVLVIVLYFLNAVTPASARLYKKSYSGYEVHQVEVETQSQLVAVNRHILERRDELDVWKSPHELPGQLHLLLPPGELNAWRQFCHDLDLNHSVLISDVAKLVSEEAVNNNVRRRNNRQRRDTSDEATDLRHRISRYYARFSEIESWLLELNRTEPMMELLDIGRTEHNRTLYVAKITASRDPDTPAVWMEFGQHSREWVAISSGIYLISNLLEGYYQKTRVRRLVEDIVWYIMPVVNPDGYVFSHDGERYWRKNRATLASEIKDGYNNTRCIGVDLNRNWDYHWGETGVSRNSCSIVYPGPNPMSELETQAVSTFILQHTTPGGNRRRDIHAFVTIHSYGQYILTRWAYANSTTPDHIDQMNVTRQMSESIAEYNGTIYKYGSAPNLLYSYSGGGPDWARGVAKVKYSLGVEARDRGAYGFSLPQNQIIPTGEEIFIGLLKLGNSVLDYVESIVETQVTLTDDVTTQDDVAQDVTTTQQDGDGTSVGNRHYVTVSSIILICAIYLL